MKRLISLLLVLTCFWSVLFSVPVLVFAQINDPNPAPVEVEADPSRTPATNTPSPAVPTSDVCGQILRDGRTDPPEDEIEGEIIVLLNENIQAGGSNIPCSRIIECLRKELSKPDASGKRPTAEMRDAGEILRLKTDYSQCIIAGKDGLDLLNNYARLVYQWIAGLVGSICILIIIVSGIQISIGGLSQEEVGSAKERITRSLVGLAVLFMSAFILYSINPIFFS